MLESLASAALKSMAGKLAVQIYELFTSKSQERIDNWNADKAIAGFHHHIKFVREVKTLWQMDKAVDIDSFYVPPFIEKSHSRIPVNELSNIVTDSHVLLEGIAGQGKSILLRYLCAAEMEKSRQIPIFIELRKIREDRGISYLIGEWFELFGVIFKSQNIKELIKKGKLILFLDAFDEIPELLKSDAIEEIERLCKYAEGTSSKVIISSRPRGGLEASVYLEVVRLSDLTKNDYRHVIRKLSQNERSAELLIERIEQHRGELRNLLITPLLVTLLLVTYKSFDELPEQLSDFYDVLFYALLKRHDGTKPGYTRPRKCELNDKEYREIFNAFCFESKQSPNSYYMRNEIYSYADTAIMYLGLPADPEEYLHDIVKVTCLLVNDGEEFRFIHKSVQEYFCASFLSALPEMTSSMLINELIERHKYRQWMQELRFLEDINRYRYYKHFKLPLYKSVLNNCSISNNLSTSDVEYIYGESLVSIYTAGGGRKEVRITQARLHYMGPIPDDLAPEPDKKKFSRLVLNYLNMPQQGKTKKEMLGGHRRDFVITAELLCDKLFHSLAQSALGALESRVQQMEQYVKTKEDTSFVGSMSLRAIASKANA